LRHSFTIDSSSSAHITNEDTDSVDSDDEGI
jgi:hypothetical protein